MSRRPPDISRKEYEALATRLEGLERALSALSADNEQLAADNAALASELERERAASAARTEAAVAEAVSRVRAEMQAIIDSQAGENARLVQQFQLLQQAFFGSRSERVRPDQLSLFNDCEAASDCAPEPVADDAPEPRRRRGGPRRVDMSRLETVVVEHELAEGDRACPACGSEMREVRVEVTRKLRMVPAHLVCEEHRTHVYVCSSCSGANAAGGEAPAVLARAPRPAEAFPRSLATPSLVAWAIEQKYALSLPLHRIEQGLSQLGCDVSRADLSNWVMLAWERWLVHIRDGIRASIRAGAVIHADETPVQVLREPGRSAQSKSYCWVFCAPACGNHAYDYVYAPTRSGGVAAAYLAGWSGTLVTDGYQPYFALGPSVTNVACLAHVRRRFALLVKAVGGDAAAEAAGGDSRLALDGRRMVDRVFRAEDAIGGAAPEERARLRAGDVARAMSELESWCRAMLPHATPGLKLEEALRYALAYMPYVRNALSEGRAELTNNRAERAVKPFVIGRKNWLFSNTPRGAEASCGIYSVVVSARESGLSPLRYVEWLLEELPLAGDLADPAVVRRFLPWSDGVPDRCRVPGAETERLRAVQEEPIADVDPGALREDE